MSKKIGIIARVDNGGLANLTYDFWKHIHQITKSLTILSSKPYQDLLKYPEQIICEGFPTLEQIDEFLKDIDVVLAFETPYNWNIFSMAKERGIKTILIPNYEWTEENPPIHPDLYLCPSLLDRDIYKYYSTKSEYLPIPINRELFPFRLRTKAETFVFNNGHGGTNGRNGLEALLQAIPLVKSDVKFIIRSQVPIPEITDKRVDVRLGGIERKDLFKEGDVFVSPRKFGALLLPTWEAISSGMPVLSTDIYPFNAILPKSWFFKPERIEKMQTAPMNRVIDVAVINPETIAQKIDQYANKDITKESKKADEIAENISWENMRDKFIKLLEKL